MTDNTESQKNVNGTRSVPATLLRPGRWTIFGFRFVPLLLFAAGTCGIIYGVLYHRIPVIEKRVEKYTVQVLDEEQPPPGPPEMGLPGWGPPRMSSGWESGNPPIPPPPKMKTEERTRKKEILTRELELTVNRAVTVDGIKRIPTGQLVWAKTDAAGGGDGGKKGPAACPT